MTSGTFVLAIIFSVLGFHSTTINVLEAANASTCVDTLTKFGVCNLNWNVSNATLFKRQDKLKEINDTLAAISTAYVNSECVAAIRHLLCVKAFPNCNETNEMSPSTKQCQIVANNCTMFVAKTYGSTACPSITGYNNTECVDIKVNSSGYCPATETYKVPAENVSTFLTRANKEKVMSPAQLGNTTACQDKYKRIYCRSFVPSNCSNSKGITKEKCEQELQCLPSKSTLNRTELCLKFPMNPTTSTNNSTTIPQLGFPYRNITITVRLGKIQYNPDYANNTSTSYKELSANITTALTHVYKSIAGFEGVEILSLTCNKEVAVKHKVIIRSDEMVNATVVTAKLDIANQVGFLKEKITDTNKPCEPAGNKGHGNNWVYMIVFVCVTALLLLAMVLCKQS